jgi:hypothetical protein
MALPSSGALSLGDIAVNQGASSVGVVTPYSLYQLCTLTGVGTYYDGAWFRDYFISNFYSWAGYGYKFGSPAMLHDFGLSNRFPTSSSAIIDTSGNARNGTFVTGTGNGTATNVTGYTTGYPANIAINSASQYAIRLNDVAKFSGTTSYTVISWVKVTSFPSSYPAVVGAEGRSGSTPIGWSMHFDNVSGYHLNHTRWNLVTGVPLTVTVTFGAGGAPSFATGTWYMTVARWDGSLINVDLYANGSRYGSTSGGVSSLSTDASWGAFIGLRYNNWLNGNVGYTSIYTSALTNAQLDEIYEFTRYRYA